MAAKKPRKPAAPRKPPAVANNAFMSAKWTEVCKGRSFRQEDVPALTLLVQWYAVVEKCMREMDTGGDLPQITYENDMGDIKAMPTISTMKQASAEIRQLNKQLGINDEATAESQPPTGGTSVLQLVSDNRQKRAAR